MMKKSTRGAVGAFAALLTAPLLTVAAGGGAHAQQAAADDVSYEVTFTNTTKGQYLTPPNWTAHDRSVDVFQRGRSASPGVEAVAELGGVPVLAEELSNAVDARGLGISGVGADAPVPPGETVTFTFDSSQSKFSLVSMLICTNDGFGGIDSVNLPKKGTKTFRAWGYDAGTELNTENRADIVSAPFCGDGPGTDVDQPEIDGFGRINFHPTLRGVGDLPSSFDWRGPVAEVTITPVVEVEPGDYSVEFENITKGQYLTPPNWAAHSSAADVFSRGSAPSPGVVAVAELGQVPVLAAELTAAVDDTGVGVSGVGDAPGPLAPGDTATAEFTTDADRFSVVSMIICTNDGFAGLDSKRLPGAGDTETYYLIGYDAGSELNTENRADIVSAPFCGEGAGTDVDQPEIEGFGRINFHPTIRGVGDLPLSFDWTGPVMKITVTNNA